MTEALRTQILLAVKEIGPCTCREIANHMGLRSSSLGQQIRFMGEAGLIVKVGLTSSNAAIWAERCDRASELMHKFITSPSGVPL